VRKVAATAISTRSNPARLFERSSIVKPLEQNCPDMAQFSSIVRHSFCQSPSLIGTETHSSTASASTASGSRLNALRI
jgi:hypothetical protein